MAVFVLLAFPLLSGVPCRGQSRTPATNPAPRTFSIRGSLRNSDDGRTIEMVKVDLKRPTGETVSTTFTRSNGEFEFGGLPNGVYLLVVEEKGFEPINENVEIYNSSRPGVYLFLKRPLELSASEPGVTVSARELSLPRKAREAMQKGRQRLYEKQDAKGSLAQFQRAVAEVPSFYEAYRQMGIAYMRLGQTADAEHALLKSVELSEGRYADAHFTLAQLLSNNERFAEAEPSARRGLDLDPNAWQGHYELARALLGLNRLETAEKSALQARTRKPDFPPLHLILANIHIRKRDYPALLQDLDSFLKLDPNGPMSEQARQTREQVQRALANPQNTPAVASPKP
jgi:tetratricopeptide (TPR) repeat protein